MKPRLKSAKARDRAATIQHILQMLHKWGIHTLGEFAALDKEQIGLRLGPGAIHLWERAQGKTTRLLKLTLPLESFEETFEFENEIETTEPLLFMLRRFLQQLSRRLGALYLVTKELTLRLTFLDKSSYERCFKIPEPTNDIEVLFRMLHTHLEQFKSECPIVAVSLTVEPAQPSHQQFGLFETALRDPNQLYGTLSRLTGLFGSERVVCRSWKRRIVRTLFGSNLSHGNWMKLWWSNATNSIPRVTAVSFFCAGVSFFSGK